MTYNNNFTGRNSISRAASAAEKIANLISYFFYIVKCLSKKESIVMTFKVAFSLFCFISLVSVAYFVSVGALGAFAAILIALGLLGAVAFTFSSDN